MPNLLDNDKVRAASWRILELITLRKQSQYLTYALAALAIAEMGQANLPASLAAVGSGIGVEALGSLLGKMADGQEVSEEIILGTVDRAVQDSGLAQQIENNRQLVREIQRLHSWQRQMRRLSQSHQQTAQQLLAEYEKMAADVKGISEKLEKVATSEQNEEIKDLLIDILDYLTAPEPDKETSVPPTAVKNPFGITGQIQDNGYYLVRQPFTQAVLDELAKGVSLSIVGASQTGKSSLLWHLCQTGPSLLEQEFVYIDMQLIANEDDFFACLWHELDVSPQRGYLLGRSLQGRRIVLCLDEFEKMTWDGFTRGLRSELRGLAGSPNAPLTLVLASRSPLDTLFSEDPTMTSPLGGLCTRLTMPSFTLTETQRLVQQYLPQHHHLFTPETVAAIWQQTQGHPRQIQQKLKEQFDVVAAD